MDDMRYVPPYQMSFLFLNHLEPLRSPNSLGFALAAGRRSSLLGPFGGPAGPGASILRMDTEALRSWRSRWI